ncbi:3-dehydroquinate synthase [Rhizocola hellebori]|uniref:3-dehydroquinate synthase n=1 Tax=Rhizocola hellebori TaxID=1392758 RepID=A0A8J3VIW1_9ACTN|nr:iron-containing alcohol dehydrogenase [Rhizocola hellebori]GIH07812.1 3-dehydroquinate synthase [Rhizocola hellebori]
MLERHVPLDGRDVRYLYGADCGPDLVRALAEVAGTADSLIFVVDRNVAAHAEPITRALADTVALATFEIDAGERQKTLTLVEDIVEHAITLGATKNSAVVGMGGGMVGNAAGLAAALLYRGVRLIHLPTTPVAAFDSVLSVKQAVNLRGGKNLCGTYHAPSLIACDLRWLTSVPHGELLTGLAEMAKNVLAVLPQREEALGRALRELPDQPIQALLELLDIGRIAKTPYLDSDPRERHEALIFEYGHTMGHAVEFVSAGTMNHGEAVAWGMLVAAEVSHALGHLSVDDLDRHYRVVSWLQLPPVAAGPGRFDRQLLRDTLATDNKRGYLRCRRDEVPMVLLSSVGKAIVDSSGRPLVPVPLELVMTAFETVAGPSGRGLAPLERVGSA